MLLIGDLILMLPAVLYTPATAVRTLKQAQQEHGGRWFVHHDRRHVQGQQYHTAGQMEGQKSIGELYELYQ